MIQYRGQAGDEAPAEASHEAREWEPFAVHAAEIAGHVNRLTQIWALRARLRTQRLVVLVLAGVVGAVTFAVFAFQAARLVVRGLTAGLSELAGGRAWVGELGSGLMLFAILLGSLLWIRSAGERRLLKGLPPRHADRETSP